MKASTFILLSVVLVTIGFSLLKVFPDPSSEAPLLSSAKQPTKQVASRIGPRDIYPPAWAAGELDLETSGNTGQTICNKNWSTKSIRPPVSYTNKLKLAQMKQLGLVGKPSDYEEDHLCSLEIGGSPTSTRNLWPEPYQASIADGGAKVKDGVENALHKEICAGHMTPQEACHIMATDWFSYYQSHK